MGGAAGFSGCFMGLLCRPDPIGAEFTQVYARKYGSQIVPDKNAVALTEEARLQQGMKPNQDEQVGRSIRRDLTLLVAYLGVLSPNAQNVGENK